MINHKYLQKRFKTLHKNRISYIYMHTNRLTSEQVFNLNTNWNFIERLNKNYFGERQELE